MTEPIRLRALAFDVDGVFTDGTVWLGPTGEEYKGACFLDIMGIARARRAGMLIAFISGEDTPFVHLLARRLGVEDVWAGCKNKAAALTELAARHALDVRQICFMGDDINDVGAMELAGFSAAPATAHRSAQAAAMLVTTLAAGRGAVREVLDFLEDHEWSVAHSVAS
jgi:3-deoxy-D-manno-octulosonate 8-phosphate phosphatase (KDO 8-P phosphatase)